MAEAEDLGQNDQAADGYAALLARLNRVGEFLQEMPPPPWAQQLVGAWRSAAELFAERWQIWIVSGIAGDQDRKE